MSNPEKNERMKIPGLVFTHDGLPGYQRRKAGRGFRYLCPKGLVLRDQKERKRINSLAVPPAYKQVWICMMPNGHLQATGLDARGRKQYRYHEKWHEHSAQMKFAELPGFTRELPKIRRKVKAELDREGCDRTRLVAGVVALLDRTGLRIGNHRYAKENRSFGLVSLLSRHVQESESGWTLRFRGKSGQQNCAEIHDARIEALIDDLQDLPGQYLFCYKQGRRWKPIESTDVNRWLKEASGADFTAKQFRTWRATMLCARELARCPRPETQAEARRAELAALRSTAAVLNHTAAVCRKYYVHPNILAAYRSGELQRQMQKRAPRPVKADGSAGLRADERRVLAIIEKPIGKKGREPRVKQASPRAPAMA